MACIHSIQCSAWHFGTGTVAPHVQHLQTGTLRLSHSQPSTIRRCCFQRRAGLYVAAAAAAGGEVTLTSPSGSLSTLSGSSYTVGSSGDSDIPISGSNCQADHARLEHTNGRVYCTALAGDPDDFLCSTFTWLNGNELRRGVAYLVQPGSKISFGNSDNAITVDFEEQSGVSPALEMVMKGMASSDDIKKRISE